MDHNLKKLYSDLITLLHPYYSLNLLLSSSFYVLKTVYPICDYLYGECELNWREWEITMFMAIVIIFRSRKAGAVTMLAYLSSAFMYLKIGNTILFFNVDPRIGVCYGIVSVAMFLFFPEPTYSGPENIIYFRGPNLNDELNKDKRVVWLIAFYAAWSPACVTFAPVFAELSAEYAMDNLKFGKLDVTRYPEVAKDFYVNDSAFSKQLPTLALFRNGKETMRRPLVDAKGRLQKFFFTVDNIKVAFELNSLYTECKNNPLKKKKQSKSALEDNCVRSSHAKSE